MKYFFLQFLVVNLCGNLLAQPSYIPYFKQAEPLFMYNLFSNYNKKVNSEGLDKYNAIRPSPDLYAANESEFYFINYRFDDKSILGGYELCKLNLSNYNLDFCYEDPYDSLSSVIYNIRATLRINYDNIDIYGLRGINIVNYTSPLDFAFHRVHDINDGHIIKEFTDTTNKIKVRHPNINFTKLPNNKSYIYICPLKYQFGKIRFEIELFTFDTLMNQKLIKTIKHDSIQPLLFNSYQRTQSYLISDSTYMVWLEQHPTDFSKYKYYQWLYFINFADTSNIKVTKIDATDKIKLRFSNTIRFYPKNGEITIMDVWQDSLGKIYSYQLIMDEHGNEKSYIEKIKIDEDLPYGGVYPLRLTDTMSYYLVSNSIKSKKYFSYDIVKVSPSGIGTYIASLFTENDKDDMVYFAYQMHMTDDDVIILNGVYGRELYLAESNTWLVGFKLQDLIKGSQPNSTDEIIKEDPNLVVYPNPGNGKYKIEAESAIKAVTVLSINGKQIEFQKNLNQGELDISHLQNGYYIVIIHEENGTITRRSIIKR
jgi:hypothetical protein